MPAIYSNPDRETNTYALPDVEVLQLTAEEIAERDEDMVSEYLRRPEFRLATMNSRARDAMLTAMIEENNITGGWMFWCCFPGCMPDSDAFGPYATYAEAVEAAREMVE